MVNGDVDGGAPSDLSAGGQRLSERSEGCEVGTASAADPLGVAGWATAQDRHARGFLSFVERNIFEGRPWAPMHFPDAGRPVFISRDAKLEAHEKRGTGVRKCRIRQT
jgi:hypothetical protein